MTRMIAFALLAAGCSTSGAEKPSAGPPRDGAPARALARVSAQEVRLTVQLPGELSPYEAVAIYPRVGGFVEEVRVDRGSRVRRGQTLARLSAPERVARRAEAEAKVAADRSTVARLQAAAATPGVVAQHDLEIDQAQLQADEERVKALRTEEGYLTVVAPFDGVVTERNVHPGALVGPPTGPGATPMLRVEQIKRLRLTVAVPEVDASGVVDGAEARFAVRAWPAQSFGGTIARVAHAIEVRTRTMPVELDVDNADERLAPGMFAEVDWPIRRAAPSLVVPAAAVVQSPERTFVDRVRGGVVEVVAVERGASLGAQQEIFGPLKAGDEVLARGSEELRTGDRAQVGPIEPPSSATR